MSVGDWGDVSAAATNDRTASLRSKQVLFNTSHFFRFRETAHPPSSTANNLFFFVVRFFLLLLSQKVISCFCYNSSIWRILRQEFVAARLLRIESNAQFRSGKVSRPRGCTISSWTATLINVLFLRGHQKIIRSAISAHTLFRGWWLPCRGKYIQGDPLTLSVPWSQMRLVESKKHYFTVTGKFLV